MTGRLLLCLLLLTGCAAVEEPRPEGPLSGERLVEALRDGGYVVVVRHTATEQGGVDDPTTPTDCAPQRELTDVGRQQARDLGKAVRDLGVPIGRVVASPYCRTRETAELAFGAGVTVDEVLLPLPGTGKPGNDEAIVKVKELLGEPIPDGENTFVVTHISVIEPVTGATPEEGGSTVFAVEGDGAFRVVADVPPGGWAKLVEQVG